MVLFGERHLRLGRAPYLLITNTAWLPKPGVEWVNKPGVLHSLETHLRLENVDSLHTRLWMEWPVKVSPVLSFPRGFPEMLGAFSRVGV